MKSFVYLTCIFFYIYAIGYSVAKEQDGNISKKSSFKRKAQNFFYENDSINREGKELNKNWPFLPENFAGPAGNNGLPKPFAPSFPFARPKPSNSNGIQSNPSLQPPIPVWGWGDDKGGWTSMGWISVEPTSSTCTSEVLTTSTVTSTDVLTSTSTVTTTLSSTSFATGWTYHTGTDLVTSTTWETDYTTLESTSVSTVFETSVIETTSTQMETSTMTETFTIINTSTETSTAYETSTVFDTSTSTAYVSQTVHPTTESIVLEPSVSSEYMTSIITLFVTETPTITTHIPKETTITTGLEVIIETIYSPMSAVPEATVTEIVPTSSNIVVGTVTSKKSTSIPQCTLTETEYLTTVTSPAVTYTAYATQCGLPCSFGEKCMTTCTEKTLTKFIDVTSTSVVTASEPLIIKYTATETKTEYNVSPSTLFTTTTLEATDEPAETTITAFSTATPISILTETVDVTISQLPTTITTTQNLCTITIFETCTATTTLDPVTLTLYDTVLVEVDDVVTMQTTKFTAPPIPTSTSYVQGDLGLTTLTVTEVVVTNSEPTTVTITSGTTTVGRGKTTTTITPTVTILKSQTAIITSTPVISTTFIKKHTLKVEELTTDVEGTTEYYHITPTVTSIEVVEVTPTPSTVYQTNLLVETTASTTPTTTGGGGGWKRPPFPIFPPMRPSVGKFNMNNLP